MQDDVVYVEILQWSGSAGAWSMIGRRSEQKGAITKIEDKEGEESPEE